MSNPTLISCPACGAQVSNQAPACLNCGQPITSSTLPPSAYQQPSQPPPPPASQQYDPPRTGWDFRTKLGVGIACLVVVLGLWVFVIYISMTKQVSPPVHRNTPSPQPTQAIAITYPKERTRRGEKLFNGIAAKYKMGVEFGWHAKHISLPVPSANWNKLSKEDQVNLTLYAESLVPAVKSSPRKYVDKWKARVQNLELSYDEFVSNASSLCNTCWQIEVGEPIKDINGIWDVEGSVVVSGNTASEFRRAAEPNVVSQTSQPNQTEIRVGMSPREYLSEAKRLLGDNADAASDDNVFTAYSYLKGITKSSLEYKEAQLLIPKIEPRAKRVAMRYMEPYARKK